MSPLEKLLKAIADRRERGAKQAFGYGITTADRYLSHFAKCAGDDVCQENLCRAKAGSVNWDELVKEAASRPVYSHDEMEIEKGFTTNSSDFKGVLKNKEIEIPPRTIMVFRNIVTTPKGDRDGDILRTDGARVDPKMPLLWQHLHTMPIGKYLETVDHNAKLLRTTNAIIDSPLGNDAAQLIEFGALRISHGFMPLEIEELQESKSDHSMWIGYDIKQYEIWEQSVVSVPSNVDAVIETFSRGKLADPTVKSWAKKISDSRPLSLNVGDAADKATWTNLWSTDEGVTVTVVNDPNPEEEPKVGDTSEASTEPSSKSDCQCHNVDSVIELDGSAKEANEQLLAAIEEITGLAKGNEAARSAIKRIAAVRSKIAELKGPEVVVEKEYAVAELFEALILKIADADTSVLRQVSGVISQEVKQREDGESEAAFAAFMAQFTS